MKVHLNNSIYNLPHRKEIRKPEPLLIINPIPDFNKPESSGISTKHWSCHRLLPDDSCNRQGKLDIMEDLIAVVSMSLDELKLD
ncbi:MAG: hypothetical protein WCI01_07040 [Chlorobiaceae bacterium]